MEKKKFQTLNVLSISAGHLFHDIYSSFTAPILPLLIQRFSMSYSLAALLTLFQQIPNLLNPFLGIWADRVNVRIFIIIAPAITGIAMSLLGASPGYVFAAILLLVAGIGSSFFHVPTPVMIRQVSGDKLGKGMSWYMFGGEIARTLGPLIILGAISLWGAEGTYRLIPFGILASVILYFRLKTGDSVHATTSQNVTTGLWATFKEHLPLFLIIIGILTFRSILRVSITIFLPTYMEVIGVGWQKGTVYLSVVEIAAAAGTLFWGSISDKMGRRNALLIMTASAPFLMLGFLKSHGWMMILFLILMGFFLLGITPVLLALVQDRARVRQAFVNGLFMSISSESSSLASLVIGGLSDWVGIEQAFHIAAYLSPLAVPFVLMIKRSPKKVK
ncbi:MAG TPA: MFS transporter [Bacteroidales bacterium]|nr:MFS transporter [Bacteroidales bacterium]HNS46869.1 MFS transporter [Bacteroidales bacterium]